MIGVIRAAASSVAVVGHSRWKLVGDPDFPGAYGWSLVAAGFAQPPVRGGVPQLVRVDAGDARLDAGPSSA